MHQESIPFKKEAILSACLQAIAEETERADTTYAKNRVPTLHLGILRRHLAQLWTDAYGAGYEAGMHVRAQAVLSRLILTCTPDDGREEHGG